MKIYIGMSLSNIAGRLRKHLSIRTRESDFWQKHPPSFAQTIIVPQSWEAPSFEEFLIQKATSYGTVDADADADAD